jgi:hypothetical protein
MFVALAEVLCVCAIVCGSAAPASGQNLAFTPGIASTYAGDPTAGHVVSSGTYSGPLSNWSSDYTTGTGLVMTFPTSLALDSSGNMYIVDRTRTIRAAASSATPIPAYPGVTPQSGYVYTIGGNGTTTVSSTCTTGDTWGNGCPATQATINTTFAAVDANGNVYFGDQSSYQVRVIYAKGTIPGLSNPVAGNIYAVAGNGTASNTTTNPAIAGDGGPATSSPISTVYSVAVDSHGNIFINDTGNYSIRVMYVGGSIPGLPANPVPGNLYTIAGVLSTAGVPLKSCAISPTNTCGDGGPATAAQFNFGYQVAVDPSGNIYLADANNTRVRAIFVAGSLPGISSPTVGYVYTVAGAGTTGATTLGGQAANFRLQQP